MPRQASGRSQRAGSLRSGVKLRGGGQLGLKAEKLPTRTARSPQMGPPEFPLKIRLDPCFKAKKPLIQRHLSNPLVSESPHVLPCGAALIEPRPRPSRSAFELAKPQGGPDVTSASAGLFLLRTCWENPVKVQLDLDDVSGFPAACATAAFATSHVSAKIHGISIMR